jgi:hypothetical protein
MPNRPDRSGDQVANEQDDLIEPIESELPSDETNSASVACQVDAFVRKVESLAASLPSVMLAARSEVRGTSQRFASYAKQFGLVTGEDDQVTTYSFKPPYDVRAARIAELRRQAEVASDLLPQVFVLALIGQFDAYLGRLLRALLLSRPELIEASERSLTFAQLTSLGTLEAAREYVLDKEVETVLRKSHPDQFVWMEGKFNIELRKGLPSWPAFVELTERRNLFAHTDGVVSDQYLSNCRNYNVALGDECKKGVQLGVDPDYFRSAHACVLEVGVKLAQVLWRKLMPEEIDDADQNLNEVAFDLIVAQKYDRAINLLDFGTCTLKKHSSDQSRKMMQINRAQAYKWTGNDTCAMKVLDEEDWSACGPQFQLALAVLRDDFSRAADIMRAIGKNGDVNETAYQEWPLFQEFRQSGEFAAAFEGIFGAPFVHIEKTLRESELEKQRQALETLRRRLDEDLGVTEDEIV